MLRRGSALLELLVTMAMMAVVGALAASAVAQQARVQGHVAAAATHRIQVQEALLPVARDIGSVSARGGDIPPGAARDSTLTIRATVATGLVCALDTTRANRFLVAVGAPDWRVDVGDTAWGFLAGADGRGAWRPALLGRVVSRRGRCTLGAATLELDHGAGAGWSPAVGTAVRFTRHLRYSFYRGGDGDTYLGIREYSHALGTLATVQPVAGPFDRYRSRFAYLDSAGSERVSGAAATDAIAAVRVVVAPDAAAAAAVAVTIPLRGRP